MQEFPNYFAGAEHKISNAHYILFGVPYDKTTYYRKGTQLGPSAIRQASWAFEPFDIETNQQITDIPIHDYGNLDVSNKDKPETLTRKIKTFVRQILKDNQFPIAIGGEHLLSVGITEALTSFRDDDFAVVSLDAHFDFRDQFEDSKYSHACVIRRIAEFIPPENIVVLGVRSAERQEKEDAEKSGITYIDCTEIREKGMKKVIQKAADHLQDKQIYLSIDMDVFDAAFAPGVSTPEPFGIYPLDIQPVITRFSEKMIGCDIVETAPQHDTGQTALLAAAILRKIIFQTWKQINL